MRFKDKVVIVTGSARGIGKVTVKKFAQEGAAVVVWDIIEETARETAGEIEGEGGKVLCVAGDVSKAGDVQKIITQTAETFGTIHVLVNNAGFPRDTLIKNMTEEDWDAVVDTCLKGAFLCSKYASSYMTSQNYGRIINISSRAHLGNPGQANYSAAKAGIIGLTKALAKELGRYFVTVNAIAPGLIETEAVKSHPKYEMIKERQIKETPIPRIGYPEDVANAVLFLASDDASYITGEVLHVTGGRFG